MLRKSQLTLLYYKAFSSYMFFPSFCEVAQNLSPESDKRDQTALTAHIVIADSVTRKWHRHVRRAPTRAHRAVFFNRERTGMEEKKSDVRVSCLRILLCIKLGCCFDERDVR